MAPWPRKPRRAATPTPPVGGVPRGRKSVYGRDFGKGGPRQPQGDGAVGVLRVGVRCVCRWGSRQGLQHGKPPLNGQKKSVKFLQSVKFLFASGDPKKKSLENLPKIPFHCRTIYWAKSPQTSHSCPVRTPEDFHSAAFLVFCVIEHKLADPPL